jgi:uncharacterized membrane protein
VDPYVGLALTAALLFACGNALQKHGLATRLPALPLRTVARPTRLLRALACNPPWLLGLALTFVAVGLETQALAIGDVSVVKPLSRVQSVFVIAIGVGWLRESLARTEWLGVTAVLAGVFLLGLAPGDGVPYTPSAAASLVAGLGVGRRGGRSRHPDLGRPGGAPSAPRRRSRCTDGEASMELTAYRLALGFVALAALGRVAGIFTIKLFRQTRYSREAVAYPTSWRDRCTVPEPPLLGAATLLLVLRHRVPEELCAAVLARAAAATLLALLAVILMLWSLRAFPGVSTGHYVLPNQ